MTAVPKDPNMSAEVRRFLDDMARDAAKLDVTYTSITADTATIDGKNPFLQLGNATGGLTHTEYDHGTKSSGALTINPLDCFHQKVIDGGAFVLSPVASVVGSCVLRVTNNASAGAITFTGWTKKYPSASHATTNANQYLVFMYFFGSAGADYMIQARQ